MIMNRNLSLTTINIFLLSSITILSKSIIEEATTTGSSLLLLDHTQVPSTPSLSNTDHLNEGISRFVKSTKMTISKIY